MYAAAFGEKLKSIYARWAVVIDFAARFCMALALFLWIRFMTGFSPLLSSVPLLAAMAFVSAAFGSMTVLVAACALIAGQAFALSYAAGAAAAAVMLLIFIFFIRFAPDDSAAALLLPVTMQFGLPAVVPIALGLRRRPLSALGAVSGVLLYYTCALLRDTAPMIAQADRGDYEAVLRALSSGARVSDMLVTSLAVAGTVLIVYAIRRMEFRYAFEISILFGGIVWMMFILIGNSVLLTRFDLIPMTVGTAASVVAGMILQILFLRLEYRKSRKLRFEDDDFYYYVRVVPKVTGEVSGLEDYERLFEEEQPRVTPDAAERPKIDNEELKRKLEDSLRNL